VKRRLSDEDFEELLAFRTELRRFLRWSEGQAKATGLTPAQHQLLLAVRGHPDDRGPTVGDIANYLLLRPHSVVGLLDRAEAAGLVTRNRVDEDGRVVRVALTSLAKERLNRLTALHLDELSRLTPSLNRLTRGLGDATHLRRRAAR
jgi:DNA-binding MarR family transcriptional regulator